MQLELALFYSDGIPTDGTCSVNGSADGIERPVGEYLHFGDRVTAKDPCHTVILDQIRTRDPVPVAIAMDREGILPESLGKGLAIKSKAPIVTAQAHIPTCVAFTADRSSAAQTNPVT